MRADAADLGATESLCPICLARVPARHVVERDDVFLEKTCARHGPFRTIVWRGPPTWPDWLAAGPALPPAGRAGPGCPFWCGLCPEHQRPSCCVLVEVTARCNLRCPFCFAGAGGASRDPGLRELEAQLLAIRAGGRPVNLQLSGGEPTLRDDLPEIVALARSLGFDFVQLNTNGLRLAGEPGYAHRLAGAGLSCVFLQFDGLTDGVFRAIRGAPLLSEKLAAVDRCAELGLGVVLVATVVPGVNTGELGALVGFGARHGPAVRGVHFQPVSYLGRYPAPPSDADRITLPEVIRAIEAQTGGAVRPADLRPASAEHPLCSFSGSFQRSADGTLRAHPARAGCCRAGGATDPARRARDHVALRWSGPGAAAGPCCEPVGRTDALDEVIARATAGSFCISGMAFQDAWTIDLARVRQCIVHVAATFGRIVPFCAFNVTGGSGFAPHRKGRT